MRGGNQGAQGLSPYDPILQARETASRSLHTAEVTGSIPVVPTHVQSIRIRVLSGLGFCGVSGCVLSTSRVGDEGFGGDEA